MAEDIWQGRAVSQTQTEATRNGANIPARVTDLGFCLVKQAYDQETLKEVICQLEEIEPQASHRRGPTQYALRRALRRSPACGQLANSDPALELAKMLCGKDELPGDLQWPE